MERWKEEGTNPLCKPALQLSLDATLMVKKAMMKKNAAIANDTR